MKTFDKIGSKIIDLFFGFVYYVTYGFGFVFEFAYQIVSFGFKEGRNKAYSIIETEF